jgi:hypothetical protein
MLLHTSIHYTNSIINESKPPLPTTPIHGR